MPNRRDLFRAAILLAGKGGAYRPLRVPPHHATLPLGEVSVVGVQYQAGSAALMPTLREGDRLELRREPLNRHDTRAVAVHVPSGSRIGYVPRGENRRLADMLDAGARLGVEVSEDTPFEAAPGNWRLHARLSLLDVAPPPVTDRQRDGLEELLRAPPLMVERAHADYGSRAVMLAGPCAGWQRTKHGAEWLPPGVLPWPSADVITRCYRLVGGDHARAETTRAQRAAARNGGTSYRDHPEAVQERQTPPEVPHVRALLHGWLHTRAYGDARPTGFAHPLNELRLAEAPPGRNGLPRAGLFDREGQLIGFIRHNANYMVCAMLEEGFDLRAMQHGIAADENRGGLVVYYTVVLTGGFPENIRRRRAALVEKLAAASPADRLARSRLEELSLRQLERLAARTGQAGAPADQPGDGAVFPGRFSPQYIHWRTAYARKAPGG